MKIKLLNWLLVVDILVIILVICTLFVPSNVVRVILGLPFMLYFPGYMLVEALFVKREEMEVIERVGISSGMSLATVALIGFGLNYTPWGIRLEPVLYSISGFIILVSGIAMLRQARSHSLRWVQEFTLKMPGWEGSRLSKTLTIILVIAILGAIGVLAYTIIIPKVGETFSEFYILGAGGKAENYPSQLTIGETANVTVGIVNHENKETNYQVVILVAGQQNTQKGQILLVDGEKWENAMVFTPISAGDNQKVEFLLFKDNETQTPAYSLHIWVNVKDNTQ